MTQHCHFNHTPESASARPAFDWLDAQLTLAMPDGMVIHHQMARDGLATMREQVAGVVCELWVWRLTAGVEL